MPLKPTQPGWYWLRQDYLKNVWNPEANTVERIEVCKGSVEVVQVGLWEDGRGKKRAPTLIVVGRGWREKVNKTPDHWVWDGPITQPESLS